MNNRLLHPDEQKILAQVKKGQSLRQQYSDTAAACADTHCAAGVPANSPYKAALEALQAAGQNYPAERAQLRETGLFGYTLQNEVSDWASRDQVVVRGLGALQAVGGVAQGILGVAMISAGRSVLVRVAGGVEVGIGLDNAYHGAEEVYTGTPQNTLGQQVLTDLGLSPTAAAWTYGGFGLVAGAGAGVASALSAADGAGSGAAEGATVTNIPARPNFYVTSDGTAVPATGYRALAGQAADNVASTGLIMPKSPANPTYFTFNNISDLSASQTQSLLQIPYTPTNWASFDTLQLIGNNLEIPTGLWNTTTLPEPIINSFPEFGEGGATQAITNNPVSINGFGTFPTATGIGK
jgi:hypothetical protein